MFWSRFFEGYGLVVASSLDGRPVSFIYMAGDPPDSVRDACEAQHDQLEALVVAHAEPRRRTLWRVPSLPYTPIRRVLHGVFEKIGHFPL